ncbi:hypothetical protein LSM04_004756 [Trypanosoma melophagium]|uniref:uncharacterized protein n=1 Tax=Trypanosoma melophagium TaxID=715481 RepID=UPI00351A59E1|nr:hypothetical protein LSM04_004756 [Trypanosoma melophagium]
MMLGRLLAEQFGRQGLQYEESSGILWCSLCTSSEGLVVIEKATKENVLEHCKLKRHMIAIEKEIAIEQHCPVEINGHQMLLDHHCIYPARMFGKGTVMLDETLGYIIAEDVCGGVKLIPRHKYTVVELIIPPSIASLPCEPDYFIERAIRSKKCRSGVKAWIEHHNVSIQGETAAIKRKRMLFQEVGV